jgi:hypothetical protein
VFVRSSWPKVLLKPSFLINFLRAGMAQLVEYLSNKYKALNPILLLQKDF